MSDWICANEKFDLFKFEVGFFSILNKIFFKYEMGFVPLGNRISSNVNWDLFQWKMGFVLI